MPHQLPSPSQPDTPFVFLIFNNHYVAVMLNQNRRAIVLFVDREGGDVPSITSLHSVHNVQRRLTTVKLFRDENRPPDDLCGHRLSPLSSFYLKMLIWFLFFFWAMSSCRWSLLRSPRTWGARVTWPPWNGGRSPYKRCHTGQGASYTSSTHNDDLLLTCSQPKEISRKISRHENAFTANGSKMFKVLLS